MLVQSKTVKSYVFPFILTASIILGGVTGHFWGQKAQLLKPLGDIFLNLIFTVIVPLIFFSVSSAIARAGSMGKLGKIILNMAIVFVFTAFVAAIYTIIIVKLFPPAQGVSIKLVMPEKLTTVSFSSQILSIFTVSDFSKLFSHEHMLALIVFSILVGLSATQSTVKENKFLIFLQAGEDTFMRVFSLIMYYAPIGFFAYFAVLVGESGAKLMESYVRIALIYYVASFIYFVTVYTSYAYFAGKIEGIELFWKNIFLPMVTSLATCSSAACIPVNLQATKAMGVPSEIYETAVPLGNLLHKEGSVIGGIIKIAFLFGIFNLDFSGASVLLTATAVSLLVGTVMGAIPSGGMLGEMLILTVYGFPPSVLMVIAAISIIIDPMATMLNVTGNCASSMVITRLVEGKKGFKNDNSLLRNKKSDATNSV